MDQQQILLGQNQFEIVDLQQSLDDSQILQLLQKLMQYQYLQINCILNDPLSNLFSQKLRSLTQLIGLSLQYDQISNCNLSFSRFGESLHYLSELQYLQVKFQSSTEISVKEFGRNLSALESLNSFSLTIFDASYLNIEGYKSICKGLSILSNLTNLEFKLTFNNKFDDNQILNEIFSCFLYLNNLKCLSFTFNKYSNHEENGLYQISKLIKSLRNKQLQRLKIEQESIISKYKFKFLKEQILSLLILPDLESDKTRNKLNNNLNNKYQFMHELLEDIIQIKNNSDLDIFLQLNIHKDKLTAKQKRLYFSLDSNYLGEKNLTNFMKFDKKNYEINLLFEQDYQSNITSLRKCDEQNYNNNLFFEQKYQNLIDFSYVQQLKELSISFEKMNDRFSTDIIIYNMSNLSGLERLDLSLYFIDYRFNQNQNYFLEWFKKLTNLKQLKVKQLDNYISSSQNQFIQSLQYLKELIKLDLENIQYKSNQLFCQSIQQLSNLQSFSLIQTDCKKAIEILKVLANFNKINNLSINVFMKQEEQDYFYDQSSKILKKLNSLKVIALKCDNPKSKMKYCTKFISSKYSRLVKIGI